MSECNPTRLAEFLTGALDDAESQALEEHLGTCEECCAELEALSLLGEQLSALQAKPCQVREDTPRDAPKEAPRGLLLRLTPWLALAAGLLVTLALTWPNPAAPSPRLLSGALVLETGEAPRRLRWGQRLDVREPSRLALPCGSELELAAGSSLTLLAPRHIQLHTGESWFRVQKGSEPFEVLAAHARVRVLGTVFRVAFHKPQKERSMKKLNAAAGAAVLVAVVTGVVLVETEGDRTELRAGEGAIATTSGAVQALKTPAEVEAELSPLRAAKTSLEAENRALRKQSEALRQELAALQAEAAKGPQQASPEAKPSAPKPAQDKPAGSRALQIRYGDYAQRKEFAKVKWSRAAGGARDMVKLVKRMLTLTKEGKQLSREERAKIYKANGKLVEIVLEVQGELPTSASGNGEYTHPFVQANLLAEHLKLAGLPLDERQVLLAQRFGEEFDLAFAAKRKGYTKGTYLIEKLVDELELKKAYTDRLQESLSAAQRAEIVDPATHHMHRFDVYSPIMLVIMQAKALVFGAKAPLRPRLEGLVKQWGVPADFLHLMAPALDAWTQDLLRQASTISKRQEAGMFRLDAALRAAKAQLRAMQAMAKLLPQDVPSVDVFAARGAFWVPRKLVEAEKK